MASGRGRALAAQVFAIHHWEIEGQKNGAAVAQHQLIVEPSERDSRRLQSSLRPEFVLRGDDSQFRGLPQLSAGSGQPGDARVSSWRYFRDESTRENEQLLLVYTAVRRLNVVELI